MAIVIEEEKNRVSVVTLASWGTVLFIIVFLVYYFFFRRPEIIEVSIPPHLRSTQQISQEIKLDPKTILNNPKFQSRRKYVEPPVPGNLGRQNPFVPL